MTAPHGPRCPDQSLHTVMMGGQPAASCRACGGHAVRRAALRKAADPKAVDRLWTAVTAHAGPGTLACPDCASPMHRVDQNSVELDVCLSCALTWFDPGERRTSTSGSRPPAPNLDYARQRDEEERLERARALADARAGKGVQPATSGASLIEGVLQLLAGILG